MIYMEKIIELVPLAEIGSGCARITDNSVEIEVNGISGGMKAWLIGGEAVAIGNIVDGKLRKNVETGSHYGVLITQSGRQMLIGKYRDEEGTKAENKEILPFDSSGFNWKKVTGRHFDNLCDELRFLISNKKVYDSYRKYGHYYVGENERAGALAVACANPDINPLEFGNIKGIYKNGYVIVCVDKATKKLYIPK